jgi:outer membrane protein, heavy metal efflux system
MRYGWAALVAANLFVAAPLAAQTSSLLTLPEAFQRVSDAHPDLKRARHLRDVAVAEVEQATQRPALNAGVEIENALGSGASSGFDQAEITLSLASVLEWGGKRAARTAVAQSRLDALAISQEARRLDLFAEVARRYLDVLGSQTLEEIANAEIAQRERTSLAAARRLATGASPQSVALAAQAALARARLQKERARAAREAAIRRLAILWNERQPQIDRLAGDVLSMPRVPSLQALSSLIERSPELKRFTDESRLREARLQLARTSGTPDLQWQLGARRLEATSEWAAVAGVSIALGTRQRALPMIRASQAEIASLELEREAEEMTLFATLSEAHAQVSNAYAEVSLIRDDVLPSLVQAEAAAERAYQAGALSFLEWAQVQSETATVRREQLAAALEAHRALIEIQRLTGDAFLESSVEMPR